MNIVVLDGYTLNPGDLDWSELGALGKLSVYDRTPPEERLPRAAGAEIVLTNKVVLDADILRELPKLRYICVLSTGVNVVDLAEAHDRGIPVANVPVYGTNSVAQMTMALLLELAHHVGQTAQSVRDGRWVASPDWCFWDEPLVELDGLAMGTVGFGKIGRRVGELAHALGMRVLTCDPGEPALPAYVRRLALDDLLQEADVVSLHCPLGPQTHGLIGDRALSLMRKSAFLVNTARGGLIREHDLARALNSDELAGAAVDVLSTEPPQAGNPLLTAKNCIVTPHISWATTAARHRLMRTVVANVQSFLSGSPQNVVNP